MTIADQINDIQAKLDALSLPAVDLTPLNDAIAALKAEVDEINAKLTPTP